MQRSLNCLFIISIFLWVSSAFSNPQDTYAFSSSTEAGRFQALIHDIRCVVCQNQNIADSTAPLANDLRQKIYSMIIAKQSDQMIQDYLVKRYGEFILLNPRFYSQTALLWLFPFLSLAGIFLFFVRRFKNGL